MRVAVEDARSRLRTRRGGRIEAIEGRCVFSPRPSTRRPCRALHCQPSIGFAILIREPLDRSTIYSCAGNIDTAKGRVRVVGAPASGHPARAPDLLTPPDAGHQGCIEAGASWQLAALHRAAVRIRPARDRYEFPVVGSVFERQLKNTV